MTKYKLAAAGLLLLGLMQMTGDLLRLPWLKGLGAATTASPAPKVFSAVKGLETFSTCFYLDWWDRDGVHHSLELTPEIYSRLKGPYNRRNIYGAALAYGPVLASDERTRPMLQAVLAYALTGDKPLLRELGIDPAEVAGSVRVRYEPYSSATMDWTLPHVLEATHP